jgi:hypothetical protein
MIMRKGVANGVVIVPPCEFEVALELHYVDLGVRKREFGGSMCGITSIQNFVNISQNIL